MKNRTIICCLTAILFLLSLTSVSAQALKVGADAGSLFIPGSFSDVSLANLGGAATVELSGIAGTGLSTELSIGCYGFIPADSNLEHLGMMTALLSAGWSFSLNEKFALSPTAGTGISVLWSSNTYTGASSGIQIPLKVGCGVDFIPVDRLTLKLTPGYLMMIESGGVYHGISIGLGASYTLLSLNGKTSDREVQK